MAIYGVLRKHTFPFEGVTLDNWDIVHRTDQGFLC